MTKEEIKTHIDNIQEEKSWIWDLGEEAGAEIWRINNIYFLFEIPQYGGESRFVNYFHISRIDAMIKVVESWT